MSLAFAALLVLVAGVAIGATSIGGVLVVPALHAVAGLPLPAAIASTSGAFLLVGLWMAYRLRPQWQHLPGGLMPVLVSALLGAVAGARLVAFVPAAWVQGWVGLLALASGLHALATAGRAPRQDGRWPGAIGWLALGGLVGLGSALSGTGGPVMLLPLLLLRGLPIQPAVLVALAVQVPIALASTGTHLASGTLALPYWPLALVVGALLIAGAAVGGVVAQRATPLRLRRATALALIATGLWFMLARR